MTLYQDRLDLAMAKKQANELLAAYKQTLVNYKELVKKIYNLNKELDKEILEGR